MNVDNCFSAVQVELWSEPAVNGTVDVRIAPFDVNKVSSLLSAAGVSHKAIITDVEKLENNASILCKCV